MSEPQMSMIYMMNYDTPPITPDLTRAAQVFVKQDVIGAPSLFLERGGGDFKKTNGENNSLHRQF